MHDLAPATEIKADLEASMGSARCAMLDRN